MKGRDCASLPSKVEVDMTKAKQLCETSSKNGMSQLQIEEILRGFFWLLTSAMSKNEAFPFHLSKVPRLPRKIEARSYQVLHLSHIMSQNHLSRLEDGCSKMQRFSGNQRPDLLTYLMEMIDSLLTRSRIHGAYGTKRRLNVQKWSEHGVFHFYL